MQSNSSCTSALPAALTAASGCLLLLLLLLLATAAATCCCSCYCHLLLPLPLLPLLLLWLHSVLASSHLDESRQVSHWQQQRIDIVDYAAANFHIMRRNDLRLRGWHLLFGVAGIWHLSC
jgi:hypothetical protein